MKTKVAQSGTNSFLCNLCLNPGAPKKDREYCRGNGAVVVDLKRLAKIRHGQDFVTENVKFSCGHSHTIALRGK